MGCQEASFTGGIFACFIENKSSIVSPPVAALGLLECLLHRSLPSQLLSSSHEGLSVTSESSR